MEQTVKCKICGSPYVIYSHYAGDQSACPSCTTKARGNQKLDSKPTSEVIYNKAAADFWNTPVNMAALGKLSQ